MVTAIKNYSLMAIMLVHAVCMAVTSQELFLRGNKAYKEGRYQAALAEYQTIKSPAWAVSFNKGNCYYALAEYPQALAEWHKAYPLADKKHRSMIVQQAKLAQHKVGLPDDYEVIADRQFHIPLLAQQLIILMLFMVFALMMRRAVQQWQKKSYSTMIWASIVGVMAMSAPVFLPWAPHARAIVLKSSPLTVGKDLSLASCGTLKAGECVLIAAQQNGWYKVNNYSSDGTGWVPEDALCIIT